MNEVEKLLREEQRTQKSIGISAKRKRSGAKSKRCTLPHERLTKKQLRGLNGIVESVKLNEIITLSEFKGLTKGLKEEYLANLRDKHGARKIDIAKMFGVSESSLNSYLWREGIKMVWTTKGHSVSNEWLDFINGTNQTEAETEVEVEKETEDKVVELPKRKERRSMIETGTFTIKGTAADVIQSIVNIMDGVSSYEVNLYFTKQEA